MDWPVQYSDNPAYELAGEVNTGTTGTTIDSSGSTTANTKGNWDQLVASTEFEASGVWIDFYGTNSIRTYLVDIGIGAAASEQVLIPDILYAPDATLPRMCTSIFFPISVPRGSRLSARIQAANMSVTREVYMAVRLVAQTFANPAPLGRVTAYGVLTGSTRGTSVDPGGTADTMVYTELSSSIANRIRAAVIVAYPNNGNAALTDAKWRGNLAKGAGGSEIVMVEGIPWIAVGAADKLDPTTHGPFAVDIAALSRLALGLQCSITDATDRVMEVAVYGLD